MVSWLFNRSVKASDRSNRSAAVALRPAAWASVPSLSSARCEPLEDRVFFSATPDLTNSYVGSVTFKYGSHKVKEAVTLTIVSQDGSRFINGQITSADLGTIDVSGRIAENGKGVTLVGQSSGGLIKAKIASKGKKLSGTVESGSTGKGKFSIKIQGDAPTTLAAATSFSAAASSTARARPLSSGPVTGTGGLDPTIDPTTGLPIDPVTGLPIDPSVTPGDSGTPVGAPPTTDPDHAHHPNHADDPNDPSRRSPRANSPRGRPAADRRPRHADR